MKLSNLQHCKTIEEALVYLMSYPYALNYKLSFLSNQFKTGTLEEDMIALYLCGTSGKNTVLEFIQGSKSAIIPFFKNVAFNSEESIPVIIRAINLALI